jgi:CRISPR-associated endoribonuclease Cas6
MRLKLLLRPLRSHQRLTLNYNHPFMSWVYNRLDDVDHEYATFLHNQGFQAGTRKFFKHFTFSNFRNLKTVRKIESGEDFLLLRNEPFEVYFSCFVPKIFEDLVQGIFQNQSLRIANKKHQADFVIDRVEVLPSVVFDQGKVNFRASSPMVVSKKEHTGIDKYLSPVDSDFEQFFAFNLIEKYRSLFPESFANTTLTSATELVQFRLLSEPVKIKKRGIFFNEGKTGMTDDEGRTLLKNIETKVIGYYNFDFEMTAPPALITLGFYGGLGRENAAGFGFVDQLHHE